MAFKVDPDKFKHGVHPYFDQYLETATNGNVTATFAIYVQRMQLHCKVCDVTLTAPEPEDSTVDYSVQEFVRIHSHVGGHNDKPKCNCGGLEFWNHATTCPKYAPPPTPVTADFKAVEKKAIESLGKIGEFPNADEEKIKSQLAAYNKEAAEKMVDAALAKKIAELQEQGSTSTESAGKYQIYTAPARGFGPKSWKSEWSNSWTNEWEQYPKGKEQALQNLMKLKNFQEAAEKIAALSDNQTTVGNTTQQLFPEPKKEKLKPLKIATGRKFR